MGGNSSKVKRRMTGIDIGHVINVSELPEVPRSGPKSSALRQVMERDGEYVKFITTEGDEMVLCNCRIGFIEVVDNGKWSFAVNAILPSSLDVDWSEGHKLTLLDSHSREIARLDDEGAALLNLLSSIANLADKACVPHALSGYVITNEPDIPEDTDRCNLCGLSYNTTTNCHATGKLHKGPSWHQVSTLPPGAAQGCPSPKHLGKPDPHLIAAACQRGDVVSFKSPSGITKFVLYSGGRLEVFAPTGDWMYSAQRLQMRFRKDELQMMCHETGLLKQPIKGIPHDALAPLGVLADKAGVQHNIWEKVKRGVRRIRKPDVLFVCPACEYANTSGSVCRICGAVPNEALPGGIEDLEIHDMSPDEFEECVHCEEPLSNAPAFCSATGKPHALSRQSSPRASPRPSPRPSPKASSPKTHTAFPLILQPPDSHPAAASQPAIPQTSTSQMCPVCDKTYRNTVLMPCKHIGACSACATSLLCCPVCNGAITHRLEIWR